MYRIFFVISDITRSLRYLIFLLLFIDRPVSISSTAFDATPNKDRGLVILERGTMVDGKLFKTVLIRDSIYVQQEQKQLGTIGILQHQEEAIVKLYFIYRYVSMRQLVIGIIILEVSLRIIGLRTIVECPTELRKDITEYSDPKPLRISCTMQLSCPPLEEDPTNYKNRVRRYQVYEDDPDAATICKVKLRINFVKNLSATETEEENPCTDLAHREHQVLLPHSTNCSLFYKCDWGYPMLFECPEELHFDPVLQVCDWPWQAGCDSSWIGCPRPFPRCPIRYPGLLPHPFLCDRFYQCDWGTPRLQTCPTGLHFNSRLKVCDWSYNSNCQNC